jgi:phenylalanyl-tRNA synthetase beta chain
MKFSANWLREWVPSSASVAEWAEKLTQAGLEIEGIASLGVSLDKVCIGEVLEAVRHPDADRLNVCQVNVGGTMPLNIVCGASNVRAGLKVAVAQVGAVLPGDFKIKPAKIRGVASEGMICSSTELGLGESNPGIMELPADAPVGKAFSEHFGLPDSVLDVNLTPNRGDCLSVLGLARELSAVEQLPLQDLPNKPVASTLSDTLPITVTANKGCPRYLGRIIRGIRQDAQTPLWLQERLRRAGHRSIHPVVDIMNYVMLELGQPLHAFDLATIDGGIVVRHSEPGETVSLLNEQTVTLEYPALVIADQKQILALAGIMGGASSGVSNTTQDILIESAFFHPDALRPTLRRLRLQSDAAHRFERGVDPALPRRAMERASQLVLEICGGQAGDIVEVTDAEQLPAAGKIKLRAARIERVLGLSLSKEEVEDLLNRLNLSTQTMADGWEVSIPSYRFDLTIEVDLIEELARLYGYTRIPSRALQASLVMQPTSEQQLTANRIRHFFANQGYREAINYSFVDAEHAQLFNPSVQALALQNPLSAELAVMRTSLLPALVQATVFNSNRQQSRIRLFELGVCFFPNGTELHQLPKLAGIVTGEASPEQWGLGSHRNVDFFDLKGDLENLLALTKDSSWQFVAGQHPAMHPGRCAQIQRGEQTVGYMGELHPELQRRFDLPSPVYLFELDLPELLPSTLPSYQAPSKYPSIRRDLAFVISEQVPYQTIRNSVQLLAGEALQDLQLFDLYQGQNIAAGQKSIALGLTFQLHLRTLVDEEVDQAITRIVNGLRSNFSATLRE